jgi:hypothetical protein
MKNLIPPILHKYNGPGSGSLTALFVLFVRAVIRVIRGY